MGSWRFGGLANHAWVGVHMKYVDHEVVVAEVAGFPACAIGAAAKGDKTVSTSHEHHT